MDIVKIIDDRLNEYYGSLGNKYPRYTTWASDAGNPCLRYLVLQRTQWEKIPPLPSYIQPRLETGKALHEKAEETFRKAGFHVFTSPDSLYDKDLQVSGRMDFEISGQGIEKAIPVEVKSVEDYNITRYKTAKDILLGDWWVQKWLAQISLYCWLRGKEKGLLYLRSLKNWRIIEISILDPDVIDFVNQLLENLKKVNEHIKNGILPDRIKYEPAICKNCSAKCVCLPDEPISDGEVIIDEKLEKKLVRRDELIALKKEYDQLDKELKEVFKNKNNILVGNYIITGKQTKAGHWTTKIGKVEDDEKPKE